MRNITACIVVLISAFVPHTANAQVVFTAHTAQALMYCEDSHLYSALSANAPTAIAASFAGPAKILIFRTCTDAEGNVHYFIRKPRPNRNGVCRIFESEVFKGTEKDFVIVDTLYDGTAKNWYFDMNGWKSSPPDEWTLMHYLPGAGVLAQVTDQPCPPGNDANYIPVTDASDGMLKTFDHLWHRITSSPETFTQAIANVPLIFDATPAVRDAFRKAIFDQHGRPEAIDCHGSDEYNSSGCTARVGYFAMEFDITDTGLAITGIYEMSVA